MKKAAAIQLISSLLILLFTYAFLGKAADYAMFTAQLSRLPVAGRFAAGVAWSILLAEAVIVLLLFLPVTRMAGFIAAAALLFVFTLFLVTMVVFAPKLPCSCGGIITHLSWTQHIFFNLFFLVAALTGVYLEKHEKIKGPVTRP